MIHTKLTDTQLVSMYVKGSEEAFALLLKRHKAKIFSTIYLIVKDRDLSEDLLQEVMIKAINKLRAGEYNDEGKFLPWICRIARNLAIDTFRREKRYPMDDVDSTPNVYNSLNFSEESIEDHKINEETHRLLKKLIEQLPETQREVLMMRHYSDMSFQEIAEETGVSINTALGRMRYALINLKKQFDKENFAYDRNQYATPRNHSSFVS